MLNNSAGLWWKIQTKKINNLIIFFFILGIIGCSLIPVNQENIQVYKPSSASNKIWSEGGAEHTKNIPTLSSPTDINYQQGSTGHSISWIANDDNPNNYVITKDGLNVKSGTWTSGNPITINVDGLSPSSYTYAITVYDAGNNSVSDSVNVVISEVPTDTTDKSRLDFGSNGYWFLSGTFIISSTILMVGIIALVYILRERNY